MTQTEALKLALEALEKLTNAAEGFSVSGVYFNEELWARKCLDDAYDAMGFAQEALAQPEQDKERCVGCEACIDTACGRDECPKGWPKAAQPEQEPVACVVPHGATMRLEWASVDAAHNAKIGPLYTTPPQRKPLTDEEIGAILEGVNAYGTRLYTFARAIEAAHGIKE